MPQPEFYSETELTIERASNLGSVLTLPLVSNVRSMHNKNKNVSIAGLLHRELLLKCRI